ncbi:oxidoreductase, partial [Aeromicrobium sp. PE09-221]|uniref:NAD(P)/FAD-dependent oxidoreductase n=1 Tax=Aeromicrobium sp. PE09-221 TaxID=1898043 RepID=UPI000B6B4DC3
VPGDVARYVRTGLVMLDVDAAPRSAYVPLFEELGVPYEEWDSAELASRVPGLDVGRYWPPRRLDDPRFWHDATQTLGGVFTPDAGHVSDPQLAAQNLAAAAVREGARFRFQSTVAAVHRSGDRVSGVELDDGSTIWASIVVNAAGPWSGGLNELAGVGGDFTVSVRPMRPEGAQGVAPGGTGEPFQPRRPAADLARGP